jgi:hypothetical protein
VVVCARAAVVRVAGVRAASRLTISCIDIWIVFGFVTSFVSLARPGIGTSVAAAASSTTLARAPRQ